MRATDERMSALLLRMQVLRRRRENGLMAVLWSVGSLCAICLVGLMEAGRPGNAALSTLYGSALLYSEAGGYVLVGVITFVLGAAITGLCLWKKLKGDRNHHASEKKEP